MDYSRKITEQPSCILICGKTELLDRDTLKLISEYYRVVAVGEKSNSDIYKTKISKRINTYIEDTTSDNFRKIMFSYSPDVVWFFSGFMDGGDGLDNEYKKIESVIHNCSLYDVSKLVYVSSINSLHYAVSHNDNKEEKVFASARGFDCYQAERLVEYSAEQNNVKSVILRVPYLYDKENCCNYLGTVFDAISDGKPVDFPYNRFERFEFLSVRSMTELLIAITEETMDRGGTFTATSGDDLTYSAFASTIEGIEPRADFRYNEDAFYDLVLDADNETARLRKEYGFIPAGNLQEILEDSYRSFNRTSVKKNAAKEKIKKLFLRFSHTTFKFAELIILFLIVQLLLKHTTNNVMFKYVDLRLFFVVILGTTYGMFIGLIAGLLECISLFYSYIQTGVTGTMLFYNMDYWLPFAIYLMTGAITGYLVSAKDQKLKFEEEEVVTLQNKYLFLNDVYMSVIDNKEEYKRQILGYQDSFGKIFEAVENLDSSTPADIFMNGVETLERILDNHSIAIYTMDQYQKFARLVACSREMNTKLQRSLNIDKFREVYDVIVTRETWKNTDFKEGLPIYSYAIVEKDNVRLMISIYEASSIQMGLYYMNLFTILCHLIRVSFMRALEYQAAIQDEKYIKDTEVLKPEYFEIELASQRNMSDAGVASYVLLKLNTDDVIKTCEKLENLIRHTDFVGMGSDGGNYLLLTQINKAIFETIGERLKKNDIDYTIVEGM